MRNLTQAEMEAKWKKLTPLNYRTASHATPRYNCLAFANGDERKWWEAGYYGSGVFWPSNIRKDNSLDSWVKVFESQGYRTSVIREPEPGKEKVAIYVDAEDLSPSHVAISDGRTWKSKLGKLQDIEHDTLDVLEGSEGFEYGIVERILERPKDA